MTNYNDGKWHGWSGGECPVHPRSKCDLLWSDGSKREGWFAGDFSWGTSTSPVAFRVVKEHKEPREFWLGIDNKGHIGAVLRHKPDDMYGVIHVREVME